MRTERITPSTHSGEVDDGLQGSAQRTTRVEKGLDNDDESSIMMMRGRKAKTTTTKRWMRVVFAPWIKGTDEEDEGVEFEIWSGGVRAIKRGSGNASAGSVNAKAEANDNEITQEVECIKH